MALAIWLFLATLSPSGTFPPDGVILVQQSGQVELHWRLPGKRFRLEVWQGSQLVVSREVAGHAETVRVEPGKPVRWHVAGKNVSHTSVFTVADGFEYHADGPPGREATHEFPGMAGGSGDVVRVRLSRDGHGMHMVLWHRKVRNHYLFSQPGVRFLVSARGGDGAPGADGRHSQRGSYQHGMGRPATAGVPGTAAGSGGRIVVSTATAPWRDYLLLDVSPGQPGRGGKGGNILPGHNEPDGMDGRAGIPGKVETLLENGPTDW